MHVTRASFSLALLCARHAATRCEGGWQFTSVRPEDGATGAPIRVLVEPFALPLWPAETRTLPPLNGERFELLRSPTPFAHVAGSQSFGGTVKASSYTGALATEAATCELGAGGAVIVGLRPLCIESIATMRPVLTARCRLLADAATDATGAKRRALELWSEASQLSRSIGQRSLDRKLASLGGAAAELMRTIPAADQAEMSRRGGRSPDAGRVARTRNPREYLDTGETFAAEAGRVHELLLGSGVEEAALPDAEYFESFIALRWASGGSEAAHALACGVRRAASGDASSLRVSAASSAQVVFGKAAAALRWAEAARLTEQGLAAMRVEASLLTLGDV